VGTHSTPPCAMRARPQKNRARLLAVAAAAATAALIAPRARAQSWVGPGGGNFSGSFQTASNWNPAAVPQPTSTATFSLNQSYTVTFSTNASNLRADLLQHHRRHDLWRYGHYPQLHNPQQRHLRRWGYDRPWATSISTSWACSTSAATTSFACWARAS